jgi:DNA-binding NarL/FixJ family response regulator
LTADSRSDGAGKIAVLIVEGDARVRHGIRSLIELFPELDVLGEVASARAALDFVANAPASVVIVDLEPSAAAEDLQIVRALSQKGCSVVAMSVRSGLRSASLAAGAVAFVEKDERGAAGLVEAMRAAASELNPSPDRHDSP